MNKGETLSKVLVAIDGSDMSFKATDYGIEPAKKYHSNLIIFHVIHIPATGLLHTTESPFKEFIEKRKDEPNRRFP